MSRDWTKEELQAASAAMRSAGHLGYEEFTAEVEAAVAAKKAVDDFARQQTEGMNFCPRCGRMTIKDRLHTNAWSRYAEVYICDMCGMDEALRDAAGQPLPLKEWAIAKK